MKIFYRPPFPPPPQKEKKNPQQVATTHLYCKLRCTEFQHTILVSGVWFTIAQTRRTVGVTGDLFFTIYPLKIAKRILPYYITTSLPTAQTKMLNSISVALKVFVYAETLEICLHFP